MKQNKGFTLVELSVVMIIIALMVGLVVSLAASWMTTANQASDAIRLKNIVSILQNYYIAHGSLPCPARPDIALTNSANGVAAADCFTTCPAGSACTINTVNG